MINDYLTNQVETDDRAIHLLFSANRWEQWYRGNCFVHCIELILFPLATDVRRTACVAGWLCAWWVIDCVYLRCCVVTHRWVRSIMSFVLQLLHQLVA